jgi:prevent-host-death family protein
MATVNIHDAKTHLSRLVARVARGESFVIAKAGKPLARVIPIDAKESPKDRLGFMKGELKVPKVFDDMGRDEIGRLFTNGR